MTKITKREFSEDDIAAVEMFTPDEIRKVRYDKNLSRYVCACFLNISESALKQLERGDRKPSGPTRSLLTKLKTKGVEWFK